LHPSESPDDTENSDEDYFFITFALAMTFISNVAEFLNHSRSTGVFANLGPDRRGFREAYRVGLAPLLLIRSHPFIRFAKQSVVEPIRFSPLVRFPSA